MRRRSRDSTAFDASRLPRDPSGFLTLDGRDYTTRISESLANIFSLSRRPGRGTLIARRKRAECARDFRAKTPRVAEDRTGNLPVSLVKVSGEMEIVEKV